MQISKKSNLERVENRLIPFANISDDDYVEYLQMSAPLLADDASADEIKCHCTMAAPSCPGKTNLSRQ